MLRIENGQNVVGECGDVVAGRRLAGRTIPAPCDPYDLESVRQLLRKLVEHMRTAPRRRQEDERRAAAGPIEDLQRHLRCYGDE